MKLRFLNLAGAFLFAGCQASARQDMTGMDMSTMPPAQGFLMNLASGTSLNPVGWPMPMVSTEAHGWRFNFMAQAFLVETQETGLRGHDKLYSTNWLMAAASHRLGRNGAIQFDGMFSLEPATITDRRYPLLFQTGESAFGKPIVDGQHPHDLFMAVGVTYANHLSDTTTLEVAFHPVGDPALGPVAYPHRSSAAELPQAPISHHLQDSTHIVDDVVTVGLQHKQFKLEASGFHGAEPDEFRWNIDQGKLDSWSARLWYLPAKNWAAQISTGHLTHPEALEAGDQERTTASLSYARPLPGGSWSTTAVWGRNHYTAFEDAQDGHAVERPTERADSVPALAVRSRALCACKQNINSFLLESVLPIHRLNFLTARFELADKNELLGLAGGSFRIGAYTAGYTRDFPLFARLETGVGGNVTFYSFPGALDSNYGNHPLSANVFLRVRLKSLQP